MFSKILPKLFMWKLNIVLWQSNFVAISRRNRQSFRLVEIRLYPSKSLGNSRRFLGILIQITNDQSEHWKQKSHKKRKGSGTNRVNAPIASRRLIMKQPQRRPGNQFKAHWKRMNIILIIQDVSSTFFEESPRKQAKK